MFKKLFHFYFTKRNVTSVRMLFMIVQVLKADIM